MKLCLNSLKIRKNKIINALFHLKNNNPFYSDIKINEELINSWPDEFYHEIKNKIIDEKMNCDNDDIKVDSK